MILRRLKGEEWYSQKFIPTTQVALFFAIPVIFSLKENLVLRIFWDVLRIAVSLVLYFTIMFVVHIYLGKALGATYAQNASVAFTETGNNFELTSAVAIGVFGLNSEQIFTGVVGSLIK